MSTPTIRTLSDALVLLHGASPADVVWCANALLLAWQAKQPVDATDAVAAADAARHAALALRPVKPAAAPAAPSVKQPAPMTSPRKTPVAPPRPVALPASLPVAKPVNKAALAKLRKDVAGRLRFALSAGAKNAVLRLPSQDAVRAFDMAKAAGGTEAVIQAAIDNGFPGWPHAVHAGRMRRPCRSDVEREVPQSVLRCQP